VEICGKEFTDEGVMHCLRVWKQAGAGVIVAVIAGYVRIRRNWSE